MSKRSERREAERQTHKADYQALRQQRAQSALLSPNSPQSEKCGADFADLSAHHTPIIAPHPNARAAARVVPAFLPTVDAPALEVPPQPAGPSPISEAQLTANRANSQLSTGPFSDEGKAISSKNALKHGLTSKTTVLPTEDPALYQRELDSFLDTYQPAAREELLQVETLVDSLWRLARLRRIETGILAKGCIEFQDKAKSNPEVEAYLKYEKSIRNLHIQEARLQRQIQKSQAELTRLQTLRRREEAAATAAAKQLAKQSSCATAPNPNGFVCSTPATTRNPTTPNTENPRPNHR